VFAEMEIGHLIGEHRADQPPPGRNTNPTSLVTYRQIRRGLWCRSSIPTMVAQVAGLGSPFARTLASIAESTQLPQEHNVQRRALGDRTHPFLDDARTLVETCRAKPTPHRASRTSAS